MAETIFPTPLGHGNPEFPYHALEPESIRLVRLQPWSTATNIHCSLSHQYQYYGEHSKYMALSYCWGDTSQLKEILLNGRPFRVSANLWHAMAALHTHDAIIPWWIDAICINQGDVAERNEQVQQMWRIFSSALRVMVWLGTGAEEVSSPVLPATASGDDHDDEWEERSQQLRMLTNTHYFSRIWIVPEILNAPAINVMCGRDCLPWSTLCLPIVEQTLDHLLGEQGGLVQLRRLAEGRYEVYGGETEQALHVQFMKVLYLFIIGDCWDVRDKIFALLGHPLIRRMGDVINLRVDYRMSVEELAVAVLAQFHRLVSLRSVMDSEDSAMLFPVTAYRTLMNWLQEMLRLSFTSPAFGYVLREQVTKSKVLKLDGSDCLLATLHDGEFIVLSGDLLTQIDAEESHQSITSRCRICIAILAAQDAVEKYRCVNCSQGVEGCHGECLTRQRLLRELIRHGVRHRNRFCKQCMERTAEPESPPIYESSDESEDVMIDQDGPTEFLQIRRSQ